VILQYAKVLDTVKLTDAAVDAAVDASGSIAVVGEKAILMPDSSSRTTLGHFSDGSAALYSRFHGEGKVFVAAFPVGLGYFRPAMPFRPVARGNSKSTHKPACDAYCRPVLTDCV